MEGLMADDKKHITQIPVPFDLRMQNPKGDIAKVEDIPDSEFVGMPISIGADDAGTIIKVERSKASRTAWLIVEINEQFGAKLQTETGRAIAGIMLIS
jgi:hypothetical protein